MQHDLVPLIRPNWTSSLWERPLAAADRLPSTLHSAALRALQCVFPPALTDELLSSRHPVVFEQVTYAGRLALLELGVAIACLGVDAGMLGRLRDSREYEGAAAELRAALLFVRGGARVTPPMQTVGLRGEFEAIYASGERLGVESKRPDVGERELDALRVKSELMMGLITQLAWLQSTVAEARATFRFAPSIMQLGDRRCVDEKLLTRAIDDAEVRVRSAVCTGAIFAPIDLGPIGTLTIRPEEGLTPLQFDAFGPPVDLRQVMRRLRRNLLNKGTRQASAANLPGVIVLDVGRDGIARGVSRLFVKWASRKPSLAALLVMDRTVMGDGRMYGSVDFIAGPLFEKASVLASAFDLCSDGHIHYNLLSTPSTPCPMSWLPRVA